MSLRRGTAAAAHQTAEPKPTWPLTFIELAEDSKGSFQIRIISVHPRQICFGLRNLSINLVSNAFGLHFIHFFKETKMRINRMAGLFLLIFGVINVLQEIHLRSIGLRQPGLTYAITTALFFTVGAALLLRGRTRKTAAKNSERTIIKLT